MLRGRCVPFGLPITKEPRCRTPCPTRVSSTRLSCFLFGEQRIAQDLTKLGRDLSRVVLVDNSRQDAGDTGNPLEL